MTYTRHRDTQATLTVLDTLETGGAETRRTAEDEAKMFGYEEQFHAGTLRPWMKIKVKLFAPLVRHSMIYDHGNLNSKFPQPKNPD